MPCARRSDAISIAYSAEKVQFSPTIARASSGPLYGVHSATTTVFAAMTAMTMLMMMMVMAVMMIMRMMMMIMIVVMMSP